MPLIGLAPGFGDRPAPNPYLGGSGRGIGGVSGDAVARPPPIRHPEGDFIPAGRGIGGWDPLPHPNLDRRDITSRAMPPLPPQILTPWPVMTPKKVPSVLDVINEIIFPTNKPTEVEPVSHIFGIPHSIGEIIDIGKTYLNTKIFGAPAIRVPEPVPNFYTGFSPWDSAPELISEGFTTAYEYSQDLNVGGGSPVAQEVGTFLGCPVEEDDGCEPAKKRYTITIDSATGKCIKIKRTKSRKRRRRLASLSDIKDIAALKQVLGGGKTLDTWIATRGR